MRTGVLPEDMSPRGSKVRRTPPARGYATVFGNVGRTSSVGAVSIAPLPLRSLAILYVVAVGKSAR